MEDIKIRPTSDRDYNAALCYLLCKKKKWSQKEVSKLVGYSTSIVSEFVKHMSDALLANYMAIGEHSSYIETYMFDLPIIPRVSSTRKFTDFEVLDMRRDFRQFQDFQKLIEKYRIPKSQLTDILRGKSYYNVSEKIFVKEYVALTKQAKARCKQKITKVSEDS